MNENAYKHLIAWTVQNIFNVNKEGAKILNDESLSEDERKELVKGPDGADHKLLNLFSALKPALADARELYPELEKFFDWCENRLKFIDEHKLLGEQPCICLGCKVDESSQDG